MSFNGDSNGAKLPSAFQSLSTPTSSTILKTTELNPNPVNHLYGYRSHFNVNEQKVKYEQQRQQQTLPPLPPRAFHQNQRQAHQQQSNNKQRNEGEQFDNNNQRNPFQGDATTNSVGGRCEVCERSFKTQQQLDRHVSEHEKCCFDGCNFEGQSTLLKKHIEMQHNSVLFQRIGAVETDIDIEKWREERRKRYPTKANIEARQLAQEQRMQRGERIVKPNNRFGNNADRQTANHEKFEKKEHNKSAAKEKKKRPRKRRKNNENNKSKDNGKAPEKVIENENADIVRFAGIPKIEVSTESNSNVKPEQKNNALTALIGLYGDDASDDDNNEEAPQELTIVRSNFECELPSNPPSDEFHTEHEIQKLNLTDANQSISTAVNMDGASSDDEPPDVQSISHKPSEDERLNEERAEMIQSEKERKRQNDQQTKQHEPQRKIPKKQSVFDMTKKIRHQNSLLEKLLQKDIRHERNVLLQCVRYVVENDFFGVGQSTNK